MILNEIAELKPKQQVSKIFEQYFGGKFNVDTMTGWQARHMLRRVRGMIKEHRESPAIHTSERNAAYLKLIMMEQSLAAHVEDLQSRRLVEESDVQQAQVVLAAQDMVDKVQKMIEDISELQYKELPALVDSIRNQVGTAEADQFNQSATAALQGLVNNLQGSKQQLEQSQSILTGQSAGLPGGDMGGDLGAGVPGGDLGAAGGMPPPPGGEGEMPMPPPEEPESKPGVDLGRERR